MMKAKPRLANSVLARAEAFREGMLFGNTVAQPEQHPLDTVAQPQPAPVALDAGVDPEVTAAQAQGGSALNTMLDQSGRPPE